MLIRAGTKAKRRLVYGHRVRRGKRSGTQMNANNSMGIHGKELIFVSRISINWKFCVFGICRCGMAVGRYLGNTIQITNIMISS